MQEQVDEKSISLAIRSTKLTGRVLAKAMRRFLAEIKKQKQKHETPESYKGKQSLKSLVGQGKSVSNIEITDDNIKSFEKVARKYGVDFALQKDSSVEPPKWLVFFKTRDADALTAAFKEFSANTLKKSKTKPSISATIKKMKELSKSLTKDTVKNKDKGLER